MTLKKKLLSLAGILLVVGGLLLAFGDWRGPEPSVECAQKGTATSGFKTDACPDGTTIESQRAWFDWNSSPRVGRIIGLGVVGLALVTGVAGLVVRSKKNTPTTQA